MSNHKWNYLQDNTPRCLPPGGWTIREVLRSGQSIRRPPPPPAYHNDAPSITLQNSTHGIPFRTELARNTTTDYTVTAADPEDDPVTFALVPHAIKRGAITLSDHHNATAILSINTSQMDTGTYTFEITASDGHDIERTLYAVVVR